MPARPIIERVLINGVEVPLADIPAADANEERIEEVCQLVDAVEDLEAPNFILSTASSSSS